MRYWQWNQKQKGKERRRAQSRKRKIARNSIGGRGESEWAFLMTREGLPYLTTLVGFGSTMFFFLFVLRFLPESIPRSIFLLPLTTLVMWLGGTVWMGIEYHKRMDDRYAVRA